MSIREACRPAVIAPLRGLSTNAQPDRKDARWLGGYLTSSAVMLGVTEMPVGPDGEPARSDHRPPRARAVAGMSARPWPGSTPAGSPQGPARGRGPVGGLDTVMMPIVQGRVGALLLAATRLERCTALLSLLYSGQQGCDSTGAFYTGDGCCLTGRM